jgi:ribosome maturation factor RimP
VAKNIQLVKTLIENMNDAKNKLTEILDPIITMMGFELWGMEMPIQQGGTLRIYVDGENGVTLDDLGKISAQISAILDVEDLIPHRYFLEVSSPGLNRSLYSLKQYRRFIGSKAQVRLAQGLDSRRNYKGIIKDVTETEVIMVTDNEEKTVQLPIGLIEKANLIAN